MGFVYVFCVCMKDIQRSNHKIFSYQALKYGHKLIHTNIVTVFGWTKYVDEMCHSKSVIATIQSHALDEFWVDVCTMCVEFGVCKCKWFKSKNFH